MSQTEPAHTRGAIIADLACVVSEISELQVAQAKISEQTARLQSRVGHIIHLLSCTSVPVRASSADVGDLRERLKGMRGRLEATAEHLQNSAERMPPAAKAAPMPEEETSTYSRETEEIAALCRECLTYDPVTGVLTWIKPRSPRVKIGDVAGSSCATRDGKLYVYVKVDGRNFSAHRVAWLLYYGSWPKHEVRHDNLRGDDNRIMNLVEGDRFDVTQENSLRHDNTSGAIGVRLDKASSENKPWRASITRDGQIHSLGIFATKEEAIAARHKAERAYQATQDSREDDGASAASADTAPAADAAKREPSVRTAGGGLVHDGGSLSPAAAVAIDKVTRTTKDRVLDRYAEHGESAVELAAALQLTKGSVSGHLSIGRTGKDPRAEAGDRKRAELLTRAQRQPTPRDVADSAKPADPAPPPPAFPTGGIEIPAGKLIAVRGAEVHGPAGIWRTSKEVAKAFGLIADGQLYGLEPMARHGGLNPNVCVGLIPMWTAALAKIGIELHHHKGYGLRIRAIGGQA